MNIYVIVLGALLLIMMVTLGHHHRHSAADTHTVPSTGDPLVDKINQYNQDKSRMMGFGNMATGLGGLSGGNQVPTAPANNIIYPNQQSYQQQNPAQNSNSYYPPPVPGAPQSPLQQPQAQPQSDQ